MDSFLDSANASLDNTPGSNRLGVGARRLFAGLDLAWTTTSRHRKRPMAIDGPRTLAAASGALALAVLSGAFITWQQHREAAQTEIAVAKVFLESRLDAVALDLHRLAALPALQTPLQDCPSAVVQALLKESLASPLVRRFELVHANSPLRCGPEGKQLAEPPAVLPTRGLALLLSEQVVVRPQLVLALPTGAVLGAALDLGALLLPASELPDRLAGSPIRIAARSVGAGSAVMWGPRAATQPAWGLPPLNVQSVRHNVLLTAEFDRADVLRAALYNMLLCAAVAWLVLGAIVTRVWRKAVNRARLVKRLAHALVKRQFVPFVQPIVDLTSGHCVGGEVLMRWDHPQRGILGPGEFIDEAERTGLILGMSDLTMSLAAHRLAPLAQAQPQLYFSFNITPGQLREPGFAQRLAQTFGPNTLPRQQVLLELTERDFVDPLALGQLIALRADGWRIAIDDFGTGQSSLSTVEKLPIDRIKIDRAFVSTVDEKTVRRPVLDAIIGLARELHIPLIAEGVETRSQWDYLAARGVASAQGFLMARPMAIADFVRWTAQQAASLSAAAALPSAAPQARPTGTGAAEEEAGASGPLYALWQRMGSTGGVEVRDRLHLLRPYPSCFVGRQALDWIVREQGVSRGEALRQARALVALGLVRHVLDEHDFEDAELFYHFSPSGSAQVTQAAPEAAELKRALHSAVNIPWRDHCRGLLRHRQCATGSVLVTWVAQRFGAPRATAAQWTAQAMRQGALRHVFDDQPFRDDSTLYRLG